MIHAPKDLIGIETYPTELKSKKLNRSNINAKIVLKRVASFYGFEGSICVSQDLKALDRLVTNGPA